MPHQQRRPQNNFNQPSGFLNLGNFPQGKSKSPFDLENILGQGGLAAATGGASIPGQLAFQAGGAGLEFIGNLLGGDGGRGERINTATNSANNLANTTFSDSAIAKQRNSFQQGVQSPLIKDLSATASSQAGLGSGIGQAFIMEGAQEAGSRFELEAIMRELARVERARLAGFQGQLSLAGR